jgi:uncharacterized protein
LPNDTKELLEQSRTIAVVGASRDASKPSGQIPQDLKDRGYRIVPINPGVDELFGEKAYASLSDVPDDIDIVEVFRPSGEAAGIAREAVEVGAKALWLQVGIESQEAKEIAEAGGLHFVEDVCMGVEARVHDIRKEGTP